MDSKDHLSLTIQASRLQAAALTLQIKNFLLRAEIRRLKELLGLAEEDVGIGRKPYRTSSMGDEYD